MKFTVAILFVGIFRINFIKTEEPRWRVGHSHPRPLPQEIMVDAVNYIGLILLHAHNQNNENNIALSPYGATSVLVALGEGVQGSALDEILRSTLLPLDVSMTRVGLRDIHRHLKSYFIPQEGFLAGLTFSHDNVTLKSSYEDTLRFYGYDVDSFNNALYPDPSTTSSSAITSTPSTATVALDNRDDIGSTTPGEVTNTLTTTIPIATESAITSTLSTATNSDSATVVPTTIIVTTTTPRITTTSLPTTPSAFTTTDLPTTFTIETTQRTVTASTTNNQNIPSPTPLTINLPPENLGTSTTSNPILQSPNGGVGPVVVNLQPSTLSPPSTDGITLESTNRAFSTTNSATTTLSSISDSSPLTIVVQPSTLGAAGSTESTVTGNPNPTIIVPTLADSNDGLSVNLSPSTLPSRSAELQVTETTSEESTTKRRVAKRGSMPRFKDDVELVNTLKSENRTASMKENPSKGLVADTPINTVTRVKKTTTASPVESLKITVQSLLDNITTIIRKRSRSFEENNEEEELDKLKDNESRRVARRAKPKERNVKNVTSSNKLKVSNSSIEEHKTVEFTTTLSWTEKKDIALENTQVPEEIPVKSFLSLFVTPVPTSREDQEKSSHYLPWVGLGKNPKPNYRVLPDRPTTNDNLLSTTSKEDLDDYEVTSSEFSNNSDASNTSELPQANVTKVKHSSNSSKPKKSKSETQEPNLKLAENLNTSSDSQEYESEISETAKSEPEASSSSSESQDQLSTSDNEQSTETEDEKFVPRKKETKNKRRVTRSVIDYLIARYHDKNNAPYYNPPSAGSSDYQPVRPTTFAVNGQLRETNISFMTYDTVLPYRYIPYLNAMALSFPLDSTKYYLLLLLPVDEQGIDNLISNVRSTTLKQIVFSLYPTRVKATIPSFMLKGYVVLTPTLQKLGIRQIFEPRHADFSRMTEDKDIYVTNIEQAVTVTIRNYLDPTTLQNNNNNHYFYRRGPIQFKADHPFLYFVMDSQIHVALMAGKITNPLNSRIR